jgi:hypothetical protein
MNNKYKVEVEELDHLNPYDRVRLEEIAVLVRLSSRADETLREFYYRLKAIAKPYFVYRGGSHLAVHLDNRDSRRILLITENKEVLA